MSIASAQAALLELIEEDKQKRCAALIAESEASAEALLATAREACRRRLRVSAKAERAHCAALIATAQARLEAVRRQAQHARTARAIAAGTEQLPAAMLALWQDAKQRRKWLSVALHAAATRLPSGDWRISHPPSLSSDDLDYLRQEAEQLGVAAAHLAAESAITAGIVIVVGQATFDATIEGLLADRVLVEGRFCYYLETP